MNPTALCPCGSGKSQIHCCGDHPKSKISLRLFVTLSFIILLGCGIAAIAFSWPQDDVPNPAAGPTPAPNQLLNSNGRPIQLGSTSGSKVPAPLNITNPSPWQYDAATDRHYDPNHAHWHSGPSPTNPITSPLGSISLPGSQVSSPLNIANPQPWQYDAVTDRHYNPDHAHWDSGPPPNDPNAAAGQITVGSTSGSEVPAPPNISNPSPWQYDAETYRHYDSNHGHWHSGPPPNDPNAVVVPISGSKAPAPPNITNPSPWQYDDVTDRHYDPNHAHWHDGPPPSS